MAHNVSNEYKQVIYSGDARNQLKILFNGVELQNADRYCERMTVKSRIVPNGAKIFNLNNFISKEVEIIFHDIDTSIIQDQVSISIGTLVGNAYEYVPIGIFNIQDQPTNDKNKTTIKLRDNSVKFDFNYNAQPLIEENGGSATKLQILQDICSKAGVTCNITSFIGSTDRVGIYDNTITARQYIADLAEQAGRIATINRSGELIFVNINSLTTWKIPLNIVEKYELGKSYRIGKIVYEDGVVRFETPTSEYDTLYLDASNPYIANQTQVENILNLVRNFTIDSLKTGNILGNPAIDGYDLIEIYGYYEEMPNGNKQFVPDEETIVAKTLATVDLTYTGALKNSFNTQIGEEERQKNVTIVGQATFKKWVKTEIDNVEGALVTTVGQVEEQNSKISQITQTVNEINSKISDIADITTSNETTMASMTMDEINASEPIQLKVYPIGQNISYLYPRSNLYPSNTLYLTIRTIRFHNETTSENFDYILPEDLLYYDSNNYDEFLLDYGDGTPTTQICQVTKKCKYNADGTVGLLTTPETHNYTYPTGDDAINLTDGDYTISLVGYDVGYIFARLMAKNIYTTQFYTKAETESRINQKANEIEIGVSQTLSNYSTTSEMNSAINVKANEINQTVSQKVGNNEIISKINQTPEQITINANKLNLQGYITASDLSGSGTTTINGSNITTGEIKSNNYQSGTSGTKINLNDGSIDTKGFKVSSTGNMTATSGNIAQYVIDGRKIKSTDGKAGMASSTTSGDPVFWAGYGDPWEHSDWTSKIPFYVTNQGYLKASNASISGSIYSGSGTIGGWSINNGGLHATTNGYYVALYPDYLYASYPGDTVESRRWYNIVVGSPSDKKVKHNINNINNKYEKFYEELKPVSFKYNEEFEERKKESTHFGFIAQDIEKSIENNNLDDLAMIHGNKILKIDKDEIIALNTWQIQKLKEEIKELKKEMEELKNG